MPGAMMVEARFLPSARVRRRLEGSLCCGSHRDSLHNHGEYGHYDDVTEALPLRPVEGIGGVARSVPVYDVVPVRSVLPA